LAGVCGYAQRIAEDIVAGFNAPRSIFAKQNAPARGRGVFYTTVR
jgi:hypothetical protein